MKPAELLRLLSLHRRRSQAREQELARARRAHDQLLDQQRALSADMQTKQGQQQDVDAQLIDQTSSLALRTGLALRSRLAAEIGALESSRQDISQRIEESDDILSGCVRRLRVGQERQALFSAHLSQLQRHREARDESEAESLHSEHQFTTSAGRKNG